MSQDFNNWVKVLLRGEEISVYRGVEAIRLLSAAEREALARGELSLYLEGVPIRPEYVIERDCEIEFKPAPAQPLLHDVEVVLAAPDQINDHEFEAALIREGAWVSWARDLRQVPDLIGLARREKVAVAAIRDWAPALAHLSAPLILFDLEDPPERLIMAVSEKLKETPLPLPLGQAAPSSFEQVIFLCETASDFKGEIKYDDIIRSAEQIQMIQKNPAKYEVT